jgi:hypothetical protein
MRIFCRSAPLSKATDSTVADHDGSSVRGADNATSKNVSEGNFFALVMGVSLFGHCSDGVL